MAVPRSSVRNSISLKKAPASKPSLHPFHLVCRAFAVERKLGDYSLGYEDLPDALRPLYYPITMDQAVHGTAYYYARLTRGFHGLAEHQFIETAHRFVPTASINEFMDTNEYCPYLSTLWPMFNRITDDIKNDVYAAAPLAIMFKAINFAPRLHIRNSVPTTLPVWIRNIDAELLHPSQNIDAEPHPKRIRKKKEKIDADPHPKRTRKKKIDAETHPSLLTCQEYREILQKQREHTPGVVLHIITTKASLAAGIVGQSTDAAKFLKAFDIHGRGKRNPGKTKGNTVHDFYRTAYEQDKTAEFTDPQYHADLLTIRQRRDADCELWKREGHENEWVKMQLSRIVFKDHREELPDRFKALL